MTKWLFIAELQNFKHEYQNDLANLGIFNKGLCNN